MKTFLGVLQVGSLIAGLVALLDGKWFLAGVAAVFAFVIGYVGSHMVRHMEGVSQFGQDAFGDFSRSIESLRRGNWQSAVGTARSAVSSFRIGGDAALLPVALTLYSVALAATRDIDGARKIADDADRRFRQVPAEFASEVSEMRHVLMLVRRELDRGVPDPSRLVAEFLALNDAG